MKFFCCLAGPCVVLLSLLGCSQAPAKTDAQLAAEVQQAIHADAVLSAGEITVQADHGVVTLSGSLPTEAARNLAARDAASIEGVKTVISNLVVQPAAGTPAQALDAPNPALPATTSAKKAASAAAKPKIGSYPPRSVPASATLSTAEASVPAAALASVTPPAPPPPPKKVTIPSGTQITIRLNDGLDTERNQIGDQFHAATTAPIVINDETAIPSGADVVGRVVDVKSAGRFAGNSELKLELNSLSINGTTYNIETNQWSRQGKGEGKNTAIKAGGGAAVGAIIGGLAGGGKGAAIGSVAGAGAGTSVAVAKKGEQIKLAPEAALSFLLVNSLTVTQQPSNTRNAGRTPMQ